MIKKEILRKVATLARLTLTPEEEKEFLPQLQEIVAAFDKLKEVDISKERLCIHPLPLKGWLRSDKASISLPREKILALTQHKERGYLKGPKIKK